MPRLAAAAVCCAVLVLGAPAQRARSVPRFVDLSESGAALAFTLDPRVPGIVTVTVHERTRAAALDFAVHDAPVGLPLCFRVVDPPDALRPEAGGSGFVWKPLPVVTVGGSAGFAVVAERPSFVVRLAPRPRDPDAPYYDYARFRRYVTGLRNTSGVDLARIGSSRQGRPLWRVVVDAPSRFDKKTVLMVARQHGNEDGSSYVVEGVLDLLLGRSGAPVERALLERVRWVVYPLANPDGAVANQRYNAAGVDLNRDWRRAGCTAAQEPEIAAIQCDVETLHARWGLAIGGDHHGWGGSQHGGYRYARGQAVSFVSAPEHQEAVKDTTVIARHDPTQTAWQENGGTAGMLRAEMFLRYGFLIHTPEYVDTLSSEAEFHRKGRAWARAMLDTLYAPRFTDAAGHEVSFAALPGRVWVTVDDDDENRSPSTRESVQVAVAEPATGDEEIVLLLETGADTGVFRNPTGVPLTAAGARPGNGALESAPRSRLVARYVDDDYPRDRSSAALRVEPARDR